MSKLKLGKMTKNELIEWFGVSSSTYERQRKKKMEELSKYASFEPCYGGVIINEIYYEEYFGKCTTMVNSIAGSAWGEVNTAKNVADIITPEVVAKTNVKESTVYASISKWKRDNYGVYSKNRRGTKGYSIFVWTEFFPEEHRYREVKDEELKIIKEIAAEVFQIVNEEELRISIAYMEKEITEKEYKEIIKDLKENNAYTYEVFYRKVFDALGFRPYRATKLINLVF